MPLFQRARRKDNGQWITKKLNDKWIVDVDESTICLGIEFDSIETGKILDSIIYEGDIVSARIKRQCEEMSSCNECQLIEGEIVWFDYGFYIKESVHSYTYIGELCIEELLERASN